jgi:hypothetical protein
VNKENCVTIHNIGEKVKVKLEGTLVDIDAGGAYYVRLDDDCDDEQLFQIRSCEDIKLKDKEI